MIDADDVVCDDIDEGEEFDAEAYIDDCQTQPLPDDAVFHWIKVRTVICSPQFDDHQKLTGNYTFLCSCGFPKRIGICCRHILAVLFQMIINVKDSAEGSESGDAADLDPTSIYWSAYSGILQGLCSMNLCSKIKYHAALHQKGQLFERDPFLFKVTVPKTMPHCYLEEFIPNRDEVQMIPRNGLPPDSDDVQDLVSLFYLIAAQCLCCFSQLFSIHRNLFNRH
jgi:hypothetical protein